MCSQAGTVWAVLWKSLFRLTLSILRCYNICIEIGLSYMCFLIICKCPSLNQIFVLRIFTQESWLQTKPSANESQERFSVNMSVLYTPFLLSRRIDTCW